MQEPIVFLSAFYPVFREMPFEKVNARGEKRQGAFSLTKGWCAFSLTNKSRAFSLTRETQIGIKFMVWSITVGR